MPGGSKTGGGMKIWGQQRCRGAWGGAGDAGAVGLGWPMVPITAVMSHIPKAAPGPAPTLAVCGDARQDGSWAQGSAGARSLSGTGRGSSRAGNSGAGLS